MAPRRGLLASVAEAAKSAGLDEVPTNPVQLEAGTYAAIASGVWSWLIGGDERPPDAGDRAPVSTGPNHGSGSAYISQ